MVNVYAGSYNINDVSVYASMKLNLDVRSPAMAQELERDMKRLIANECLAVTHEKHIQSKNVFKQFSRWMSYSLFSVIFNLLTFYFKQRKF